VPPNLLLCGRDDQRWSGRRQIQDHSTFRSSLAPLRHPGDSGSPWTQTCTESAIERAMIQVRCSPPIDGAPEEREGRRVEEEGTSPTAGRDDRRDRSRTRPYRRYAKRKPLRARRRKDGRSVRLISVRPQNVGVALAVARPSGHKARRQGSRRPRVSAAPVGADAGTRQHSLIYNIDLTPAPLYAWNLFRLTS
jgi:hypothetical protein